MTAVYLRLAGPLQSWATARVSGNVVRTSPRPTRSGIEGLVAGALGYRRDDWPEWLQSMKIAVRTDRPGITIYEYQTINPRPEDQYFQRRLWLMQTGRQPAKVISFTPDGQSKTAIVRRTYLSDAEFLVRITDQNHLPQICQGLARPVFSPYLGRKAFPPTFPFFLGAGDEELLETLPTKGEAPGTRLLRVDHLQAGRASAWEESVIRIVQAEDWLREVQDSLQRART